MVRRRSTGAIGIAICALVVAVSTVTPAAAGAASGAAPMSAARAHALVGATYSDFTDARASATSLAYWSGRVSSGQSSQASFVGQIAASGTAVKEQVSQLYYTILGRLPSDSALAARVALVQAHHRTVDGMAQELYASDDFFADHGGHTGPWIAGLYDHILKRVASSANIAHWAAVSVAQGRLAVVELIYRSAEARGDRVRALYRRMLHRAPSASALAHWIAGDATGGDIAVATGLADSAEYATRATTRTYPSIDASKLIAIVGLDPHAQVGGDSVSGGTEPYSWVVLGLPAPLHYQSLNSIMTLYGDLSLAPVLSPRPIAIIVRDSTGAVAALSTSLVYSIPLTPAPIELSMFGVPGMTHYGDLGPTYGSYTVGLPVSAQVGATGGVMPYSFAVVGGTLPPGLSLSSTGAITGTPTVDTLNTVTLQVTDRVGHTLTPDTLWLTQLPVPVPMTSVTSVTNDGCAIATGHVYCWGDVPDLGALPAETIAPSQVPGLSKATLVRRDCAIANGAKLYCGFSGGGSAFRQKATQVPGLAAVTDVEFAYGPPTATATVTSCAVHDAGKLSCWGSNHDGSLGAGLDPATTPSSATPVDTGLSGVTSLVSEDGGFCAVASGALSCWGANARGQVGDGTTSAAWSPTAVAGLTGTTWLSTGSADVCAIANAGQLWCWGANDQGQVANGSTTDVSTPHHVSGLSAVTHVSMTDSRVCAIGTVSAVAGSVSCWGQTATGEHTTTSVTSPTTVTGFSNATAVLVENDEVCAIADPTSSVWCWGGSHNGDGTANFSATPVQATGLSPVSTLYAVGDADVCATKLDNTLWCFGDNQWRVTGTTGWDTPVLTPTRVVLASDSTAITGVTVLATDDRAVCVVSNGGHLTCWGSGIEGELPTRGHSARNIAPYRV
jgi:alpha-tubulin suppressor-like RCC1 family protein